MTDSEQTENLPAKRDDETWGDYEERMRRERPQTQVLGVLTGQVPIVPADTLSMSEVEAARFTTGTEEESGSV